MKLKTTIRSQWKQLTDLDRSLKMFLLVTILYGLFYSVRALFFNFYILSLGFDKDFLGIANSMAPAATLILGLPMGVLTDRIGRKNAAIIGLAVSVAGYGAMLSTTSGFVILTALFVSGIGETLFWVSRTPLLTRLTDRQNRNYVFSLDFALNTLSGVLGNSLGGQLPAWFEGWFGIAPETVGSYQGVIFVSLALGLLAILPVGMIEPGSAQQRRTARAHSNINSNLIKNIQNIMRKQAVWQLTVPNLFIGLGAALMVPYFNIFFVEVFGISNQLLGSLFSAASLFTGLSIMAAPSLAKHLKGRIKAIVYAQGASLIFLLAIGFSPWLGLAMVGFLARGALMNMVNPLYSAFAMEQVEEGEQGTLNSLMALSWQVGWAMMPLVSGLIQERYGFTPIFLGTAVFYAVGIGLIWIFFKDQETAAQPDAVLQTS